MLKEENIMLRNNAPEAYRVLEAKYFYVLEKLQQEHTPIIIDEQQPPQAQQGPVRNSIKDSSTSLIMVCRARRLLLRAM